MEADTEAGRVRTRQIAPPVRARSLPPTAGDLQACLGEPGVLCRPDWLRQLWRAAGTHRTCPECAGTGAASGGGARLPAQPDPWRRHAGRRRCWACLNAPMRRTTHTLLQQKARWLCPMCRPRSPCRPAASCPAARRRRPALAQQRTLARKLGSHTGQVCSHPAAAAPSMHWFVAAGSQCGLTGLCAAHSPQMRRA